jgi:hypothetical protein
MNLDEMLCTLGEAEMRDALAPFWDEAQRDCPPAAYAARFLTPEAIAESWRTGRFFTPDPPAELPGMARRIRGTPALLALAAYAHWRLFEGPRKPGQAGWPTLESFLGEDAGLFYLVVALGFIPSIQAYHRRLGLPSSVMEGTGLQIARYCDNYRRGRGRLGIYINQMSWLACYMPPSLYFRIGRFEYRKYLFCYPVRVFRRHSDHTTVALAMNDLHFTPEGDHCLTDMPEPEGSWRPVFEVTEQATRGTPITPWGRAVRQVVELPHDEWECVLKPGDPILDMHIPSGGQMTPEAAESSMREAYHFFNTHFPKPHVRAIASYSWIFSNQIEECLPPEANLAQLQRRLHLLPCASQANSGLWFVFLQDGGFDPATARRDTSLQRAILDYLSRTGRPWQVNTMFVLGEDLEHLEAGIYRRQWPPSGLGLEAAPSQERL